MKRNNLISIAQQEQMGLRRSAQPSNFVPPSRNPQPVQVLPPVQEIHYGLDVVPSSTQHVELRTSAVDRANGFVRIVGPLSGLAAFVVTLVAILGFKTPVFSISALLIFSTVFTVAYLGAWLYTLSISAEGVSMFEAKSKWEVIKREQANRWNYYNRLNGPKDGG